MQPETRFAKLGEDRIAYQVVGEGPDLIFVPGMSGHVDVRWEEPFFASFLRRLASFSRLTLFDRRGTGASDPVSFALSTAWENWADDVRAVMDAVAAERATIMAQVDAGPNAILFAATEPTRTDALILANTAARFIQADDYPWGMPLELSEKLADNLMEFWASEAWAQTAFPSMAQDERFCRWFGKYLRTGTSPRLYRDYAEVNQRQDVRSLLPAIQAPTLVIHREECGVMPLGFGRYLSEHIPNARMVVVPGRDAGIYTEAADQILDHIEEFITGAAGPTHSDRVLATIVFTDIVSSTQTADRLGDTRWKELLHTHDEVSRAYVERFRGRLVKHTGDGMLATFDGPGRAINCVAALRGALRGLDIDIRAGLHTGEIELLAEDIGGISVIIAARISSEARSGEILVSRTVRDLVAGAGFHFDNRGVHPLKGIPDEWQLYNVRIG